MSEILFDDAEQLALEHAERILDAELPGALSRKLTDVKPTTDARASSPYVPSILMAPQTILLSNEALEVLGTASDHRHIVCCLYAHGNAERLREHSATDTKKEQIMRWKLRAEMAFVAPDPKGGYRLRRTSGRLETQREFSRRLARIYRGAMLDVLMKHLQGAAGIQVVTHQTSASDTTSFDPNQLIGRGWGDVVLLQAVTVPTPRQTIG